ncbi:beta-aspartyl-peptidase [Fusobacterium sp. THCT1E2]
MFRLIKNVEVYSPKYLGAKDILFCNNKIVKIGNNINIDGFDCEIIDGSGKKAIPGYIDQHIHITGGGGEGSFKTRVPEAPLSKIVEAGVTTVVGVLGTDSTTRNVENLLAKAKSLKEEGISCYITTGAYEFPSPTITGTVKRDVTFIEEIIGVKLAISDHRASFINEDILEDLGSQVRTAGMFANKAGIVVLHMGDGDRVLSQVLNVIRDSEIPIKHFIPTHVNRKAEVFEAALDFAKRGGYIDITSSFTEEDYMTAAKGVVAAQKAGVPLDRITFSSDGYGSFSDYDAAGNLIRIGASPIDTDHQQIIELVKKYGFNLEEALQFLTVNPAKALKLYPNKGILAEDSDADMILLDENLDINDVFALGKQFVKNKKVIIKGTYEN